MGALSRDDRVAAAGGQPAGTPSVLARSMDRLLLFEPFLALPGAALVYLPIIFPATSGAAWGGLAALVFPFLLRWARWGRPSIRTPFDLPIALVLLGAVVGVLVSDGPDSIRALGTLIAIALLYYSLVNHPRPALMLIAIISASVAGVIAQSVLAFTSGGPRTPDLVQQLKSRVPWLVQALPSVPKPDWHIYPLTDFAHGLALVIAVVAAILVFVAVFPPRRWMRLPAGALAAVFLVGLLSITYVSLERLVTLGSVKGRLVSAWIPAAKLMAGHPFTLVTGTGLGSAPLLRLGAQPHNAYLELYLNSGVLGVAGAAIAAFIAFPAGIKLARWSRSTPWRGVCLGLMAGAVVAALTGIVESSPFAVYLRTTETYLWMASPLPWVLGAALVLLRRVVGGGGRGRV